MERIVTDALDQHESTVNIGGKVITTVRFAGHIDGLASEEEKLAKIC